MKKFVALFLVFAGMAAFVYFYEIQGEESRKAAETSEKSLLGWTEDDIATLEIDRAGQDPIVMGRVGGEWKITQPVQGAADRFPVDALLGNLAEAERAASFDAGAEDLAQYGLADPKVVVKATSSGGVQKILKLGGEDYTGAQVYAMLDDDPTVLLTSKKLAGSADRDLKDFRSKTVLDFDPDLAVRVEIENPKGKIALEKSGGEWSLAEPLADSADETAVSALLSALKYSRIDRFVAESDEDLEKYGLDNPRSTLRIREQGGDQWKTLQLGQSTTGDAYFARDPNRPQIFTVRKDVVDKLDQDAWQYRQKSVVTVKQSELDRFQIRRGDLKLNVRRDGGGFTITFPDDLKGRSAPPYKFFYPATDAKYETLDDEKSGPDDPRFQNPDVFIEITKIDGTVFRYEFARRGEKVYARQVETGRSGEISQNAFNKLQIEPASVAE